MLWNWRDRARRRGRRGRRGKTGRCGAEWGRAAMASNGKQWILSSQGLGGRLESTSCGSKVGPSYSTPQRHPILRPHPMTSALTVGATLPSSIPLCTHRPANMAPAFFAYPISLAAAAAPSSMCCLHRITIPEQR